MLSFGVRVVKFGKGVQDLRQKGGNFIEWAG